VNILVEPDSSDVATDFLVTTFVIILTQSQVRVILEASAVMNTSMELEASEAPNLIECTALGDKSDGGRSKTTEFDQHKLHLT